MCSSQFLGFPLIFFRFLPKLGIIIIGDLYVFSIFSLYKNNKGGRAVIVHMEQLCSCIKLVLSFFTLRGLVLVHQNFLGYGQQVDSYPFQLIRNGCGQHIIFKVCSSFGIKVGIWNSHFLGFPLTVLRFLPRFIKMGDSNVLFFIVLLLEQQGRGVVIGYMEQLCSCMKLV